MAYKVDQEKFNLVKTLLEAGVKQGQICKIVGLSQCTIMNIDQSVDLEDYREIVAQQFEKKAAYDAAKLAATNKAAKPQLRNDKAYTVTMVINVDAEHESLVAPLTALVNNMFFPDNVAVEAKRSDN